jgi:hypothetical protein
VPMLPKIKSIILIRNQRSYSDTGLIIGSFYKLSFKDDEQKAKTLSTHAAQARPTSSKDPAFYA